MRDILFRGKVSKNTFGEKGKWKYGFLTDIDMILSRYNDPKSELTGEQNPVDPETVGEYTGLLDCKGQKIFEGDILKVRQRYREFEDDELEYRILTGVITFRSGGFWFTGSGYTFHDWHFYNSEDLDVIGSIHDNPELLQAN